MTPDQWHQVIVELGGLAGAVVWGGKRRKAISEEQCAVEEGQVARIEAEGKLTRTELRETRDEMVRMKDQIAQGVLSGDRMQTEMHALAGRVDAANEKYTEILKALNARNAASAQKDPPVTGNVTFKEEKKPK